MVDEEKTEKREEARGINSPPEKSEGGEGNKESKSEQEGKPLSSSVENIDKFDDDFPYSEDEYKRFEELYERTMRNIKQGEIVTGKVLAITDQDVMVDIGFKSEGIVPLEEFGEPPEVKVGDRIEVYLEDIEDPDGNLVLSRKKANFIRIWDDVVKKYNSGETIEGTCMRRIKGGIVVNLMGIDAFLPGSQIDVKPVRDFDALIGKTFTFKIVKINELRKNIVVSRRALLEESRAEEREKILKELKKGQVLEGVVKNITDFGVFIDLGGVDGLLHINDLSWGRINHPSEVVKLDEKIKVVVLDFNDAKDRISLGLKQLKPHPWDEIEKNYPEGSIVKGKVVSITDYGAFIEITRGVEGLIHVSEMSWTRQNIHPSKMFKVGDEVKTKILSIDKEKKRISLGVKQLTPDPWENIEKKYPEGSRHKARVQNMTNFGVFVELEEGIDGLIHISDLSWVKKINHPSEILKKDQEIEVVVLEIDKKERRLSLGYKQTTEDPWPAFEKAYKVDTITTAEVIRFLEKGLIVKLPLGLEGFLPASQMVEPSMDRIKKSVNIGDELKLMVVEFDRKNKRVVLSQKKVKELEKKKEKKEEEEEVKKYVKKQKETATLEEVAKKSDDKKSDEVKKQKEKKEKDKKESKPEEKSSGADKAKEKSSAKKKDEKKSEEKKEEDESAK